MELLTESKIVTIDTKQFKIHKLPATVGRRIACTYPTTALPKIGDYKQNEAAMYELISHVYVPIAGSNFIRLDNEAAINSHCGSWETLMKLEGAMLEYNASFLQNGQISSFFTNFAKSIKQLITQTLTGSLQQLWQAEKPRSTN
jgi:hypothetical protein